MTEPNINATVAEESGTAPRPVNMYQLLGLPMTLGENVQMQILNTLVEIRDRLAPPVQPMQPDAGHQAMGMVKDIAHELDMAGQALEAAAAQLKEDGKGFRASQAKQAAMRARAVARDLSD